MSSTAIAFRIMPGMTPSALDFIKEAVGPRLAEHDESRRHLGIRLEKAWIENTNEGDMLVFFFEGDDLEASMSMLGESNSMFDLWYREKMFTLTGDDLCDYRQTKPADLIFESSVETPNEGAASTAVVLHVLPGEKGEMLEFVKGLAGPRTEEYRDFLSRHGLQRVRIYLQERSHGETAVLYAEGKDPGSSIAAFARSSQPFDAWQREMMLKINGTDFIRRRKAPPPHLLLEWKATEAGTRAA